MKYSTRITITQPGHALGYPVGYTFNGPLFDTVAQAREYMALGCRVAMLGETVELVAVDPANDWVAR